MKKILFTIAITIILIPLASASAQMMYWHYDYSAPQNTNASGTYQYMMTGYPVSGIATTTGTGNVIYQYRTFDGPGNWQGYQMMGWGFPWMMGGYGYGIGGGIFTAILWILAIVGLVTVIRWLTNMNSSKK